MVLWKWRPIRKPRRPSKNSTEAVSVPVISLSTKPVPWKTVRGAVEVVVDLGVTGAAAVDAVKAALAVTVVGAAGRVVLAVGGMTLEPETGRVGTGGMVPVEAAVKVRMGRVLETAGK